MMFNDDGRLGRPTPKRASRWDGESCPGPVDEKSGAHDAAPLKQLHRPLYDVLQSHVGPPSHFPRSASLTVDTRVRSGAES